MTEASCNVNYQGAGHIRVRLASLKLSPEKKMIDKLSARSGNEIEAIFGIRTDCLTANKSQYLLEFGTTDEIRNRCLRAEKEIDLRRASKK